MGDALGAMGINGPFLISQMVNFLVMFGLMTVLLWKPAKKRLDERRAMLEKHELQMALPALLVHFDRVLDVMHQQPSPNVVQLLFVGLLPDAFGFPLLQYQQI